MIYCRKTGLKLFRFFGGSCRFKRGGDGDKDICLNTLEPKLQYYERFFFQFCEVWELSKEYIGIYKEMWNRVV